ncbi:MAG TPA: LysM peptidoglycan-binding domain-containing protein [Thermoanaerobaculia bacterium]|nr:LysM peptidoglycan-binding domain-containing protein [Thermoanaerobaculia bacterium]
MPSTTTRSAVSITVQRALLALTLLLTLVAVPLAGADDTPPRDLHLVGDHWTAWDPPVPPPGDEVHVIVRGDTLWDLAGQFYGDPYLWPQLWEQNQYILDAHWIYPGDPLIIGLEVEEVDDLDVLAGGQDDTGAIDDDDVMSAAEAAGAPVPLGSESDIYCSGFIGDPDTDFPFSIVGSEYEALTPRLTVSETGGPAYRTGYGSDSVRYGMMTGDIVYLDGGRDGGMRAGQVFTIASRGERVEHPVTRRTAGHLFNYLGRVRVLSVQQETAIAEIVHACDPITVGSHLMAYEQVPVPLGRLGGMRPINYPTSADNLVDAPVILRAEDNVLTLGADSVVYIDRGELDDVVPGDVYTIYRLHSLDRPPVVLGELAVLAVHESSSVARILSSRYAIRLGDRLELK